MTRHDPRTAIRKLYSDRWGYDVSRAEEARVVASEGSSTYGEMMPSAVDRLVDALELEDDDVFYDLGSGMGKVVIQVAMSAKIQRCVGVELVASRHAVANEVLADAREQGLLQTEDVRFRNSDMLRARMGDATVVYTCSTAFSDTFMNKLVRRLAGLSPGLRVATLMDFDENPWFAIEDILRLDVTWRRNAKLHVYRLAKPRR